MLLNRSAHLRRFLSNDTTQTRLTIGRNLDIILEDWRSLFDHDQPDHPYAEIYKPDLRFRIAPHIEPGGLSLKGLWAFRVVRPAIRYSLCYTFGKSKQSPRMVCIPEDPHKDTVDLRLSYSFKWRIEAGSGDCLVGGMAHYRFDGASGKVQSIQVDRIVPPLRPGLFAYLRFLQERLQQPSYTTTHK